MLRSCVLALGATVAQAAWTDDQKNRPVTKVINLLKDMQKNLEKEAEEDEATYNKLACWCETNDKDKTQAIKDAEESITQLTTKIEELTATSSRLTTEIKNLEDEVAKNQEALEKATAIREKELAEFNGEEKDSLQSISAMKAAITVLSKHHTPPTESLIHIRAVIKYQLMKNPDLVLPSQRKVVDNFLQKDFFDAEPTFKQSYAPQSGEIFGILRNMLDTFQANLSQSQKDELSAQKTFEALKSAKEAEIAQGLEHVAKKKGELADTDEANVNAKEDLEDTKETLSADQKFLMDLKEKCQMTDQEWEQRQKTRQDEIQAVSEALNVLSGDDAHDTFTRTFNPSFFQVSTDSKNRDLAAKVLTSAAIKAQDPQLSALATQVRLDAFTKVKAAIDEMISKLIKEKDDEIKLRDFCTDEFNKNQKEEENKNDQKSDLETKIDTLKSDISTLEDDIKALNEDIKDLNTQLQKASENREAENKDFQQTVADQRATQTLLSQCLEKLRGFYAKKGLLQLAAPAGPPPPPGFKEYKNQAGSSGVMTLINQIIADTKVMETEAVQAEKDAQTAYETFAKNTNDAVEKAEQTIVDKTAIKASKEQDKVASEGDLSTTMTELEELSNAAAALHKDCDFVIRNFEVRQTARDEEVEALRQAKSILSGANFGFLQRK